MRNKRKSYKKKNKIFSVIENHINQNIKEYTIAVFVFFIGVVIGVMLTNSSSQENKNEIIGYISRFIDSIKNGEYAVDEKKLLIRSILSNLKLAAIIWIAGLTIVGIPVIYICIMYKGIRIGYSISAIIATLGRQRGIIFSLSTMLLQNIVAVPCFLALMVSAIKMYKAVAINPNKNNIKIEMYRHTIFSLIMTIGLFFASFIEYYFTTAIFSDIIINFI